MPLLALAQSSKLSPSRGRPTRQQIATLISQIHELVDAGIPTDQAVIISARSRSALGQLAAKLSKSLRGGRGLASALARLGAPLSEAELALVAAGEDCGRSAQALELLHTRLAESLRLRHELIRASAYPALLLSLTLIVVVIMAVAVIPTLASLYTSTGVALPATTRAMLALGDTLCRHGLVIAIGSSLIVTGLALAKLLWQPAARSYDRTLLRIPVVATVVGAGNKRDFYASLAALLSAGSDLEHALRLSTATISNSEIAVAAGRLLRSVRRGVALSHALERSGLDQSGSDSVLLRIAEATGDYAAALQKAAATAARQRQDALQRLCSLAEPLAVALMAVAVGITVLSIYQPVLGSAALLGVGP